MPAGFGLPLRTLLVNPARRLASDPAGAAPATGEPPGPPRTEGSRVVLLLIGALFALFLFLGQPVAFAPGSSARWRMRWPRRRIRRRCC